MNSKIDAPGILLKRNRQGHRVIRLHYSADPAKNPDTEQGRKWFEAETAKYLGGVNDLKWRQEMEIDFSAGSGELVFPEFAEREHEMYTIDGLVLPDGTLFYAGFDWGTRNPTAFIVFAHLPDNRTYAIWEYYASRQTVKEVAEAIHECPFYSRLEWIASDPTIWSNNVAKKDGFTSIAEMMLDPEIVGRFIIDRLMPAHGRSDETMINTLRNLWNSPQPSFKIFKSCVNLRQELKSLKYPDRREKINEVEKILDKNNHAFDATKYFFLSHPQHKQLVKKIPFGTGVYLNAAASLAEKTSIETGEPVQDVFNRIYGEDIY